MLKLFYTFFIGNTKNTPPIFIERSVSVYSELKLALSTRSLYLGDTIRGLPA